MKISFTFKEKTNMKKENWSDIEINKVFNFWKLEEYFTPFDYPELYLTVKENGKSIPFDSYHNAYSFREFPLNNYKRHNVYLAENIKAEVPLYDRTNVYCGCYKLKVFLSKMAEKCD